MDCENGKVTMPEIQWTTKEEKLENKNSKVLYAIFCGVDMHKFKRIAKCTVEKNAWDILKTTHEGTFIVKQLKMKMLTSRFKGSRMQESKIIGEFYAKL